MAHRLVVQVRRMPAWSVDPTVRRVGLSRPARAGPSAPRSASRGPSCPRPSMAACSSAALQSAQPSTCGPGCGLPRRPALVRPMAGPSALDGHRAALDGDRVGLRVLVCRLISHSGGGDHPRASAISCTRTSSGPSPEVLPARAGPSTQDGKCPVGRLPVAMPSTISAADHLRRSVRPSDDRRQVLDLLLVLAAVECHASAGGPAVVPRALLRDAVIIIGGLAGRTGWKPTLTGRLPSPRCRSPRSRRRCRNLTRFSPVCWRTGSACPH